MGHRSNLREIYYFEVGHAKFYKSNFGDFKVVDFLSLYQVFNDLHKMYSVLPKQILTKFNSD